MEMLNANFYMVAAITVIVAICLLIIHFHVSEALNWKRTLYEGILDIKEGKSGSRMFEFFSRGWAKRGYPNLIVTVPEELRSAVEGRLEEALEEMRRESMLSSIEVLYAGTKFALKVSARNWR